MKQLLFSAIILSCTIIYGQDGEKEHVSPFRVYGGLNTSLDFLDKDHAESVGLSATGWTFLDIKLGINIIKYINLEGGLAISKFKDEKPFTQTVSIGNNIATSQPTTSNIRSGGVYLSIGTYIPIYKKVGVIAALGSRGFSATRQIPFCDNCRSTKLSTKAGKYLQTGIGVSLDDGEGFLQLLYTHYFDSVFRRTVGIGVTFY